MSQNPAQPKTKIEATPHSVVVVNQPMVRDFSTGGGHGPGDTLIEGDEKLVTKKWQGYPPANLNVLGTAMPPMPEVAIPRFTGKAEYETADFVVYLATLREQLDHVILLLSKNEPAKAKALLIDILGEPRG